MKRRIIQNMACMFVPLLLAGCTQQAKEPTLTEFLKTIKTKQFVDLTHAFDPSIPHWPGFPQEKRELLYGYEEGQGSMGKGFFASDL